MKFSLDNEVLDYLKRRDAADLILDVVDIPTACCLGRLPEMNVSCMPPGNPAEYRRFRAEGIRIYISKVLRTRETLTFFLSGFGPFRKLEVAGVNLVI